VAERKTHRVRGFTSLTIIVLMMAFAVLPARAASFEDALAGFTADSFNDTAQALAAVTESGDPLAVQILSALEGGRLLFSAETKKVYFKDASDKLFDAATGTAVTAAPPSDLGPVRLNNRVRGLLSTALGSLTLMAPEPAKRISAAESVFKSRDPGTLAALDKALAQEKNPDVKEAMLEARAAVVLNAPGTSPEDRLTAIAALNTRGDSDALVLLRNLPADAPANVKQAAASAISSIESKLAMWGNAQNLWYGLSLASVLLLAAIGLAITFGVMGVINMAHGEMVMLGAYTTFVVQEFFRAQFPGATDYALIVATPAAFLVAGAFGVAIERGIIRHLYGRPLETLLATWGLSLILQQLVRTVFGPTNRDVGAPSWMAGAFQVGQMSITYNRLWIIVFTIVVFAALLALLRYSAFGLEMRAVTQNRAMASAMGIRTGRVDALTFGLGSGIAGIAGVALAHIDNVSPNLGKAYIIDSFMVVVFGGVGNLWGTLVGALTLGIANKFLEPFAGAVLGKIVILVLIILFIQKRPRGLFALKGRAVEA
jgi:urea transport system permease protein